jgi:N-acetylneuraminic acid mutarotase
MLLPESQEVIPMPRHLGGLIAMVVLVSACSSSAPPSQLARPSVSPSATGPAQSVAATPETTTAPASPPPASHGPAIGTWTATGSFVNARFEQTATLLRNGKVLVAGGAIDEERTELKSAELYDPATGRWTATGSMHWPRARHTATLLADGRVLVAGGFCQGMTMTGCFPVGDPDGAIAAAEIYDPATGKWSLTGPMTTPRYLHTATLLASGKVLVVGAEHAPDAILDSAELYDPNTGTWTATGSMHHARTQNVAAMLPDGKVLVAAGIGPVSPTSATPHDLIASAELYDPATGTWSETGSLVTKRAFVTLVASLADGRVMVVGGDGPGDPVLASAEIYDPKTGAWTETGSLANARDLMTSTLLADGTVLVAGGFVGSEAAGYTSVAPTELYDATTGTWAYAGDLPTPRVFTTATLLRNGKVLVAGGSDDHGPLASCELYAP